LNPPADEAGSIRTSVPERTACTFSLSRLKSISAPTVLSILLSFVLPEGNEIPVTEDTVTGTTFFWAKIVVEKTRRAEIRINFKIIALIGLILKHPNQ